MFLQTNNNHVNVVQNCFKVNENDIEQTQWHRCGVIVNFKFSKFIIDLLLKLLFARTSMNFAKNNSSNISLDIPTQILAL